MILTLKEVDLTDIVFLQNIQTPYLIEMLSRYQYEMYHSSFLCDPETNMD
jgi:hypothetical protein